jgi:hypothetical protein
MNGLAPSVAEVIEPAHKKAPTLAGAFRIQFNYGLHHALIEHGIGHFHEASDVGAFHVVHV